MSTTKGRKIVKNSAGKGIYQNTVRKKSAEQGMLVNQDAMVDQVNAIVSAVHTAATALKNAADVAAINTAGTALETAMVALSTLTKVDLK